METSFRDFIRTFASHWSSAMSGPLSVPLAIGGYFATQDVIRIGLFLTSIGCVIFSSYLVWREERKARLKAEAKIHHPLIDINNSYLFLDPPKYESWKGKLLLTKDVGPLSIYIEYSAVSGGIGAGFWGQRTKLPIRMIASAVKGQEITIELISLDNSRPNRFWYWVLAGDDQRLVSPTMHFCRLVLVAENGPMDYFNFLVMICEDEKKSLLLVGQNHFAYSQKWKDDDAKASHSY